MMKQETSALIAEPLVHLCESNLLAILMDRSQAFRADIHLSLFAFIDHRALGDIRHKASVDGIHSVTAPMTV